MRAVRSTDPWSVGLTVDSTHSVLVDLEDPAWAPPVWADTPARAFTLSLARAISDVSGATVIPEPWPLAEPPRRRLRVDVEKALAGQDGIYRLTGRYYVSDDSGGGSNHARSFAFASSRTWLRPSRILSALKSPSATSDAASSAIRSRGMSHSPLVL